MAEPMSDTRLAKLRADNNPRGDHLSGLTADEVGELLDELERLRKEPRAACFLCTAPLGVSICTDCAEMCADEGKRLAAQGEQPSAWVDLTEKVSDSTVFRLSRGAVFVPEGAPASGGWANQTLRELNQ
jgi:hypothetical protein